MKCLILSQGPIPTPEHKKVEGGGLRCWGLANGIKKNNEYIDITVAYNDSYVVNGKFTEFYKDINIKTWNNENIVELIKGFDSVIVSYCMGDLSVKVVDNIDSGQQLVLDCYVPIYIEVSARQSNNLDVEYGAFLNDVPRWSHVLRRGDLFLCASEPQKRFYEGVLAGLGRINPVTYGDDTILIVPYGIYRDKPKQKEYPINNILGKKHSLFKKILWFGGIYPWFDIRELVEAVRTVDQTIPSRLVIVGARNPFNSHPDFIKKYDELLDYIKENSLEELVLLQDWVSFDDRADWYLDSDVVVVINKIGQENSLAWRTRLVDFTWANLPIMTNGGDPVSEVLIKSGAASQFSGIDSLSISNDMIRLLKDDDLLDDMKSKLQSVRKYFYWDNATAKLSEEIIRHKRQADFERYGYYDIYASELDAVAKNKVKKAFYILKKLSKYVKKYGKTNTLVAIKSKVTGRINNIAFNKSPRIVIVSHQLDMSGAPFIIMDVAEFLKRNISKIPIKFYTFNPASSKNIVHLNKVGIKPIILTDRNSTIPLNRGDIVILNTVAHSDELKWDIYSKLQNGYIKKLIWYVHEDEPELIFNDFDTRNIKTFLDSGKIKILTAAVKTRDNYRAFFENKTGIDIQKYQVVIPNKYHRKIKKDDFNDKIRFIVPGTVSDGRKGQMPLFYAFSDFKRNVYDKNPNDYRDFELVYVGMENDFISRQMIKQADKMLGKHFSHYGRLDKDDVLDIISKSNITVCYSLRECLPLFVFEGMIMGHPILRNDSSGAEEQLVDGKNGYYLDSNDSNQVRDVIEKVLNRKKTTNKELEKMSSNSYEIAKEQESNNYSNILNIINESFDK
ncbi:glycosyltransferase family 4 protein [Candidatus Saccharibacteria bacterium]|nr:glycosyltransferase family 4 protein [Candidatus Saccharibacteria bacterium]